MPLALFLDKPLRDARKLAKARLREAKKLARRAKGLEAGVSAQVREAAAAVAQALKEGNAAQINKAGEKLGDLLDKHLDAWRKPAWRESVESIGVAVLVALLLRSFVVEAFKIPSGSMIPTLAIGDQIFVNKYVYGVRVPFTSIRLIEFAKPAPGEVVVFRFPGEPHDDYIKRVIAVEGDEVTVRRSVLYVNGQPVPREPQGTMGYWERDDNSGRWAPGQGIAYTESLGEHTYTVLQDVNAAPTMHDYPPTVIPPGHVFVMGDNRDHSYDSRGWGLLPIDNILGRSLFVWFSWGREGLDFSRIGTWIE